MIIILQAVEKQEDSSKEEPPKEEPKKEEPLKAETSQPSEGKGYNPATEVEDKAESGLARLDAGTVEDTTSVEDKIEAVASAIERQERGEDQAAQQVRHAPLT